MTTKKEMKERPIIFSAPMVQAIQEGRKTQTRRAIKPQPLPGSHNPNVILRPSGGGGSAIVFRGPGPGGGGSRPKGCRTWQCPYGQPGDLLWVRETWRVGAWACHSTVANFAIDYKADNFCRQEWLDCPDDDMAERLAQQSIEDAARVYGKQNLYSWPVGMSPCRWRPSIHMPQWAARIWLEVTGIRVERLQEINDFDAEAEGIEWDAEKDGRIRCEFPRDKFAILWDSINGKRSGCSWNNNPWCWIVEFRKVKS